MPNIIKIGVDIDDILLPFNDGFIKLVNKKLNTDFKIHNWSSRVLEDETKYSKEMIFELLDEFSFSKEAKEVTPIFGAIESIEKMNNLGCELYAITARPLYLEKETKELIKKHFHNHFKEVYHLGSRKKGEYLKVDKGIFSKEFGINIFIEDSLKNSLDIAQHNIPVILLDNPWNQEENLPENIFRVKDWNEILQKIEELKNII
ncbi:MAG: hypothetical protein WCO35_00605 [Candidatus Nomurabacteria bacterium]